ncbi:MAG: YlxR family protein [Oscillatoriales cyanobacterium SM2_2_1]|nr:YlxR family protein [Oscillatoriales cyanobacterium SM2_2_1]
MKGDRVCVSCRRVGPRESFWRVVRLPDGSIVIDSGMGRSAYVCRCLECLTLAQKKQRLGRSLRAQISPDLFAELHRRLSIAPPEGLGPLQATLEGGQELGNSLRLGQDGIG